MNRTGLLIAIGVGIVAGLILGLYPDIDLALSRRFFDPAAKAFLLARDDTALVVRDGFVYVITALAAPAFIALAVKLILPRRPMRGLAARDGGEKLLGEAGADGAEADEDDAERGRVGHRTQIRCPARARRGIT